MSISPLLLVVDDMPEIAFVVRRLGRRAGQEVIHYPDVPLAWAYLERVATGERRPDLVLLDINLPGPSGVELCRRMRCTLSLAAVPVAVFGEWVRAADVLAGLEAGADFVVSKELLAAPAAWNARIEEILHWPDGRTQRLSVSWEKITATPTVVEEWAGQINRCVERCALGRFSPEMLAVLLGRSLKAASEGLLEPADIVANGLLPGGLGLDAAALARRNCPELLARFVRALTEQMGRLAGAGERDALRRMLAAVIPALAEFLSN